MTAAEVESTPGERVELSLSHVMAYRNHAVIRRFQRTYGVRRDHAEKLFEQLKQWLYLAAKSQLEQGAPDVFMTARLSELDEMWHTFLLFTQDYEDFCHRRLGTFVHHIPEELVSDAAGTTSEEYPELDEERARALYGYIYDHLGEQTLREWFSADFGTEPSNNEASNG
jgi:hypothetical protein